MYSMLVKFPVLLQQFLHFSPLIIHASLSTFESIMQRGVVSGQHATELERL